MTMPFDDSLTPYQLPLPFIFEDEKPTILRWRCPNCGQQVFTNPDEPPPDMCDYCDDYTTWQQFNIE